MRPRESARYVSPELHHKTGTVTRFVPWMLLSACASACTVESLPPASSRTDGGPVSGRGTVSHEAKSQLRLYRDAAGCQSIQTVNRQFRLVTVVTNSGPERLVLEESYDVRHCLESESASSEASIVAWRPDSASAPLFTIAGRGTEGEPAGNLYRMTQSGCCGSQNLATYFSLLTGKPLFASSIELRSIEVPNTTDVRYAAFHDSFSASASPETAADSSVVGVLQWGDDRAAASRFLLRADRPEGFAVFALGFRRDGRAITDSAVSLWPGKPQNLALEIQLTAPGSDRKVALTVPIKGLELDLAGVRLPAGFRLERGK